jgi:hypothetical protein
VVAGRARRCRGSRGRIARSFGRPSAAAHGSRPTPRRGKPPPARRPPRPRRVRRRTSPPPDSRTRPANEPLRD